MGWEENWGANCIKRHSWCTHSLGHTEQVAWEGGKESHRFPSKCYPDVTHQFSLGRKAVNCGCQRTLMALENHRAAYHWAWKPHSQPSPHSTNCRQGSRRNPPRSHTMVLVPAASTTHAEKTCVLKSSLSAWRSFSGLGAHSIPVKPNQSFFFSK